jgi:hypothetical protein
VFATYICRSLNFSRYLSILYFGSLPNGTRISRGAALHSPLALQEQPQNQIEPRYKGRDSGVGFMRLLVAVQTPGA